jgi:hypothetical protein
LRKFKGNVNFTTPDSRSLFHDGHPQPEKEDHTALNLENGFHTGMEKKERTTQESDERPTLPC